MFVMTAFVSLLIDDDGATLVEYTLVVAFIALACIAAVTTLGTQISAAFSSFGNRLPTGP